MCAAPETILNLDIQVPNETRYLGLIGSIAELVAKEVDAEESDRETLAYNLNLVVTEAVTNVIQYGCSEHDGNSVRILLTYERKDLCVRVFDHGQGFDLSHVGACEAGELRERGRGLFFIKSLMDSVEYRRSEHENVLEMRKRLS